MRSKIFYYVAVAFSLITVVFFLSQNSFRTKPKLSKSIATGQIKENPPTLPPSPPEQRAEYVPPTTVNSMLASLVNRELSVRERISSDIASKIPSVETQEDFAVLVAVLSDPEDDDTVRNEVANLLSRSRYFGLADALIKVLDNPVDSPRFRSFAMQHLGQLDIPNDFDLREKVAKTLQQSLDDRHVEVRREALLALVRKKEPMGTGTAIKWLTSDAREREEIRDLAIRCVHELDLREHIPLIRQRARDENEVVRIAAIVALSQWGDEESRPAFQEAVESKVMRLQRAGKAAIERLNNPNGGR